MVEEQKPKRERRPLPAPPPELQTLEELPSDPMVGDLTCCWVGGGWASQGAVSARVYPVFVVGHVWQPLQAQHARGRKGFTTHIGRSVTVIGWTSV
jgi:hypothetical protein